MGDSTLYFLGIGLIIPAYAKQLLLASLIGLSIGFERELRNKVASLRTFSFICAGSCLFTILSVIAVGQNPSNNAFDPTRVAAGIVQGIGFIGGGVIFKTRNRVEGISTGAMMWVTAAMGMACGFNQISLVFWGILIYFLTYAAATVMHSVVYHYKLLFYRTNGHARPNDDIDGVDEG